MGICMEKAFSGGLSTEEFLRKCAELGADGVELASRHLSEGPEGDARVRSVAEELGLRVSSYNIATDLIGDDAAAEARRRRDLAEGLDRAHTLGAGVMMVGAPRPPGVPAGELRRRMAEHVREILAAAEGCGVRITMENRGVAGLGDMLGRASDIRELCEAIGSPHFGWTFDTGNFIMADDNPVAALRLLLPFVAHVHVKDTLVVPEDAQNPYHEVCIGRGGTDIRALLHLLRHGGYDGFLSLEVTHGPEDAASLRESMDFIRSAWRE